jgi:hypothetical protein
MKDAKRELIMGARFTRYRAFVIKGAVGRRHFQSSIRSVSLELKGDAFSTFGKSLHIPYKLPPLELVRTTDSGKAPADLGPTSRISQRRIRGDCF